MTRIKLCGLSRPEDIASANRVQPEFVGFVFVPGSKRYVSTRQAKRLKALLSPRIQAVGVFANAEPELPLPADRSANALRPCAGKFVME